MKAYKLLRIKKDGSLGSLFINRGADLPLGEWLTAHPHTTHGFLPRVGWHCLAQPVAPHLKLHLASGEQRAWYKVEIQDYDIITRPESQGRLWYLAKSMKIIGAVDRPQEFDAADPRATL